MRWLARKPQGQLWSQGTSRAEYPAVPGQQHRERPRCANSRGLQSRRSTGKRALGLQRNTRGSRETAVASPAPPNGLYLANRTGPTAGKSKTHVTHSMRCLLGRQRILALKYFHKGHKIILLCVHCNTNFNSSMKAET